MKNEIVKDNKEIETFEKIGKVMAEIEVSKQKATLAQIEATREDNQRQKENQHDKNTSFYRGF